MENYFKSIEKKLEEKISFEKLEIIDNSLKHKGHKFFSEDKYHLHLKINSLYLKSISRINAQKIIMNILKDKPNFHSIKWLKKKLKKS